MIKLKDANIPGWPEKKKKTTGLIVIKTLRELLIAKWAFTNGHNLIRDLIENLEFNPAEMVELDEDKIIELMTTTGISKTARQVLLKGEPIYIDIEDIKMLAQAIVKAKLEVLK